MFSYTIICIISVLVIASDASPLNNRIIGGEVAKEAQFPFQVSLRHKNEHMCGGAIIGENWCLTAAHCIAGYEAENFKVVTGSTNLKTGGIIYEVIIIIWHENYEGIDITHDIGVVKTMKPMKFGPNVQPIALNRKPVKEGTPLIVSGWGSTVLWGPLPDILQWVTVYAVDQEVCIESQKPFLVDGGMICALWKEGHGTCHGDSGGPLTYKNKLLIGVVSWGRPCARGFPDVFTRVSHFTDWIDKNIAE